MKYDANTLLHLRRSYKPNKLNTESCEENNAYYRRERLTREYARSSTE